MSGESSIEWTDATWNPVTGCDTVSAGCRFCYARVWAKRMKKMGQPRYQKDGDPKSSGPGFGLTMHPDLLEQPLRWRKPRMVFVNSMSDVFHPEVTDDFIVRIFASMALAKAHTFQVLTKRPERMQTLLNEPIFEERVFERATLLRPGELGDPCWPLPNVWLGTSIENRHFIGRADLLRQTPAAIRFISAEPLLGPLVPNQKSEADWGELWLDPRGPVVDERPALDLEDIDWLIVGGESGKGHRKFDQTWAEDLYCAASRAGTAFFMKQMGGNKPGGALEDLPVALQVREFPRLELVA